MFERHRRDGVGGFSWPADLQIEVAHQPNKTRDTADRMVAGSEPLELLADIEILALHPDHRSASGHRREYRDLIARAHRMLGAGTILVHQIGRAACGERG